MTLKEIKAQFKPGERWHCIREETRSDRSRRIDRDEIRTVQKVGATYLTWALPNDERAYETKWPKASEVLEARLGMLMFQYFEGQIRLTFTKEG